MNAANLSYDLFHDSEPLFAAHGGRAYPDIAPDGVKLPYLVYICTGDIPFYQNLNGRPCVWQASYQVDMFAKTLDGLIALEKAFDSAIFAWRAKKGTDLLSISYEKTGADFLDKMQGERRSIFMVKIIYRYEND